MMNSLFIGSVGMPEVLLIVLVVLLLFGGKKIPELMRGIGKGIHSFKEGMKDRKSTRLNSSHRSQSRMPSSA